MSDYIKREDAIKAINARSDWYQVTCNGKQIAVMLMAKDVNEILEKIPSADRPQEWIPCSERLPNDGDRIVVQYANGDLGVINSCRMRLWNIINSPYATVVAWMPLPEPWKGADDETD